MLKNLIICLELLRKTKALVARDAAKIGLPVANASVDCASVSIYFLYRVGSFTIAVLYLISLTLVTL